VRNPQKTNAKVATESVTYRTYQDLGSVGVDADVSSATNGGCPGLSVRWVLLVVLVLVSKKISMRKQQQQTMAPQMV